jgi:hypothetical protein
MIHRLFVGGPLCGRVIGVTSDRVIVYPHLSPNGDEPAYDEIIYRAERLTVTEFTCSGLTIPDDQWRVRSAVWTVYVTGETEDVPLDQVTALCRAKMIPPDHVDERAPTEVEIAIETARFIEAAHRPR